MTVPHSLPPDTGSTDSFQTLHTHTPNTHTHTPNTHTHTHTPNTHTHTHTKHTHTHTHTKHTYAHTPNTHTHTHQTHTHTHQTHIHTHTHQTHTQTTRERKILVDSPVARIQQLSLFSNNRECIIFHCSLHKQHTHTHTHTIVCSICSSIVWTDGLKFECPNLLFSRSICFCSGGAQPTNQKTNTRKAVL